MTISTDNVDVESVAKGQRWRVRELQWFMIVFGLISTVFDLLAFAVLLYGFGVNERTFQTAWFVLSLLTELAVVLVLRTDRPVLRSASSKLLLGSTIVVGAIALAAPYLGPLAAGFDFVALPVSVLAAMLLVVAGYVIVTEVAKLKFLAKRVEKDGNSRTGRR
jgi:Mg2+-importing ATPase